jgi:uncharacterized repeat protein (TIGR01451 family)
LELSPQNASVQVPIIQNANCTIDKTVIDVNGNAEGNVTKVGDIINYLVNVTNNGNVELSNVTVTDPFINLTGPANSIDNDTVLDVGENWNYTGNYTVTRADITNDGTLGDGFITNNATVDCDQLDPQNDSVQIPIDTAVSIDGIFTDVGGRGLGNVTKAGDVISYQINLTNDGKTDLSNVTVTDSLNSLTEPIKSINNDTVLNVGETWTYPGNYTVTQADINNNGTVGNSNGTLGNSDGTLGNTSEIVGSLRAIRDIYEIAEDSNEIAGDGFIRNTATFNCDQLGPKSDSIAVPIERTADCSIFKSVIGPGGSGDCIVNSPNDILPYRIVVNNDGNVDLTGVSVGDPMITLIGPTGDDFDPEVLNPGETWVYTGDYALTQDDINNNENIDNTATVSSNEAPEKSSSVGMPIDQKADLSIYKSIIGIDEAGDYMINNPGDIIQYQVAVQNNGKVDLTGVSVHDPMITLAGPLGDDVDHGVLNPGETWAYTGEYTVTQADIDSNGNGDGFIENTATARCNELSSESSSIELPIIRIPFIGTDTDSSTDKVLPVANFSTNVKSGYAPLSVQFTDLSQNAASRSWDFNNDGITDSSDEIKDYVYTTPGTYIAKLTVRNENGTNSVTAPITVLKVTSSGSSGGSHHSSGSSYSDSGSSSSVSGSTGKATVTETEIKPVNNTGIKAANEPTPVQTQSPKTSKKGSTGMPGFEIVSGIIGLLAVFLYRKK